jgi:hypothetical protein
MTDSLSEFLGIPQADAPTPKIEDVDAAKAYLQQAYADASDNYDELATVVYAPFKATVDALANDVQCQGDDCGAWLASVFKTNAEKLVPLQRKIANQFYGQLGVAYGELNRGVDAIVEAYPEAVALLPEAPVAEQPPVDETWNPPATEPPPPYVPPPYVPPVREATPTPTVPEACGTYTLDWGPFASILPFTRPIQGTREPLTPVPLPPALAGFQAPANAYGLGCVDGCTFGRVQWWMQTCDGVNFAVEAALDSGSCTATVVNVTGFQPQDAPCTVASPPPTGVTCPDGPACLADTTAAQVRDGLWKINTAQTSVEREKATYALMAKFGVHMDATTATSDWDCPTDPTCPMPPDPEGKPPEAPKPPKPIPRPTLTNPPDWCAEDVCKTLVQPPMPPAGCNLLSSGKLCMPPVEDPEEVDDTEDVLEEEVSRGTLSNATVPGDGTDEPAVDNDAGAAAADPDCPGILDDPIGWIGCAFNEGLKAMGLPECSAAFAGQFLGGLIERYVGVDMTPVLQPYRYWANWCKPTLIPSPTDLNALWLQNAIKDDQWSCLTKANGFCEVWMKKVRDSGRARVDIQELWKQLQYGSIKDKEYNDESRKLGLIDDDDRKRMERSFSYQPAPGDIVRFMQKDVATPELVSKYGLDAEFDDAYQGRLKKWGQAAGMDEETVKYYYRAAWEELSVTQNFELLHRLRPGRVAANLEWTRDDAEKYLKFKDIPEPFRKRLLETSYNVVTRTDAERMFDNGTITKKEYQNVLQDGGYAEKDAEKITDFFEKEKARQQRSRLATFTVNDAINWYVKGLVDIAFVQERMSIEIDDPDAVDQAVSAAQTEREIGRVSSEVELLRGLFLGGCIDTTELAVSLRGLGIPDDALEGFIDQWTRVRSCHSKQLTASEICKMVERGILDKPEALKRLVRIGYAPEEAALALSNCIADITERAAKLLKAALEKLEKDRKAEEKEKEKKRKADLKLAACGPEKIKCPK